MYYLTHCGNIGKDVKTVPACTDITASTFSLLLPFVFLPLLSPSPFPFFLAPGSLSLDI